MTEIVMFPHPVLRRKVAEVKKLDKKTLSEINKLKEILQKSENGAGLAATQIGVSKSFLGMKERNGVRVLINPKLVAYFGEKVYPKMVDEKGVESDFLEGCLSFPDLYGTVKRYLKIEAQWQEIKDQKLESKNKILEGFEAILWQHEYDHLLGILFVDHIKRDGGKFYLWKEGEDKKVVDINTII